MLIMSKDLFEKLKDEFYRSNYNKYRHYFDEWIKNVTDAQLSWWANHWGLPMN